VDWIEPAHGKKVVSRAGTALLDESTSEDNYYEAINILNNWRSSYAFPLTTVQAFLRYKANKIDKSVLISQRLKRVPSILNKLRRFFELVGTLFSCLESYTLEPMAVREIESIRAEAIHLANKLDVITKLQLFSVSTDFIETQHKKSGYFLLFLQPDRQWIKIDHFKNEDLQNATNHYLELEKEYKDSNTANVVLVAAKSVMSLRIAYPNYFADSRVFLENLRKVLLIN
jgi:hypothetical protein